MKSLAVIFIVFVAICSAIIAFVPPVNKVVVHELILGSENPVVAEVSTPKVVETEQSFANVSMLNILRGADKLNIKVAEDSSDVKVRVKGSGAVSMSVENGKLSIISDANQSVEELEISVPKGMEIRARVINDCKMTIGNTEGNVSLTVGSNVKAKIANVNNVDVMVEGENSHVDLTGTMMSGNFFCTGSGSINLEKLAWNSIIEEANECLIIERGKR